MVGFAHSEIRLRRVISLRDEIFAYANVNEDFRFGENPP